MRPITVLCAGSDCRQELGTVGISATALQGPKPVWRIQPGWGWHDGALDFRDDTLRSERRLLHEMVGRERLVVGMALGRECDLPIRVRCPRCHRVRIVTPEMILLRCVS